MTVDASASAMKAERWIASASEIVVLNNRNVTAAFSYSMRLCSIFQMYSTNL
jgi:hypothetical protein